MTLPYMFPNSTDETRLFGQQRVFDAVFEAGTSASLPVFVGGLAITALRIPEDWTPAAVTFQMALGEQSGPGTWFDVFDPSGSQVAVLAATSALSAGRHVAISHVAMRGNLWTRLISGTSDAPTVQNSRVIVQIIYGGVA